MVTKMNNIFTKLKICFVNDTHFKIHWIRCKFYLDIDFKKTIKVTYVKAFNIFFLILSIN